MRLWTVIEPSADINLPQAAAVAAAATAAAVIVTVIQVWRVAK